MDFRSKVTVDLERTKQVVKTFIERVIRAILTTRALDTGCIRSFQKQQPSLNHSFPLFANGRLELGKIAAVILRIIEELDLIGVKIDASSNVGQQGQLAADAATVLGEVLELAQVSLVCRIEVVPNISFRHSYHHPFPNGNVELMNDRWS